MQEFLDQHFGRLISKLGNPAMTPSFHVSQEVATAYPTIAGIPVTVDEFMEPRAIEMRAQTGKLMNVYTGVTLD